MSTPSVMSIPDFGAYLGHGRTYGYQLQKEGRLVMADDGVNVLVVQSEARVRATQDPSKAGVRERHAKNRRAKNPQNQPVARTDTAQAATQNVAPSEPPPEDSSNTQYDFQGAKAKREHWAAEREHAQYLKEAGELMERSAVVAAFADAGATLRSGLEAWQVTLPPQLVGLDESAIRTTLADQVERLLHDLVDKLGRMAEQDKAA
ncbi:MAG: hypothetical protein E6Q78_05220 [Rhodoferax sp.]|nr:MAG: hypothetical protein E6Q78_05220 [Rhodoferax sp.]